MNSEDVLNRHPIAGTHNALASSMLLGSKADEIVTVRAILLMHHHWQRDLRETENRCQYLEAILQEEYAG